MLTAEQLYDAGIPVFPCKADKKPAVDRGEDWKSKDAQLPMNTRRPSGVIGVPVPPDVVVIDLDTYKGITRQDAEQALGCPLPWEAAQIQTTRGGGQHYAFSTAHLGWVVRQGSDIEDNIGLDTRVGGRGYICTGEGYTPYGPIHLYAFAYPATLPPLPDACRDLLEKVQRTVEYTPLPEGDPDIESVQGALRHLDPGCGRSEWVKYGLALRHHFHADEHTGLALYHQWSSGELWPDGCPANYSSETIEGQWSSFKPEGGIKIGTVYKAAGEKGWRPRNSTDTAGAFGPEAARGDVDAFIALVDRVYEIGTDPRQVDALIPDILASGCSDFQRNSLRNLLKKGLKDAGLLDKGMTALLDKLLGTGTLALPDTYGKNHAENARLFEKRHYPNGQLVRVEDIWYAYGGKVWAEVPDNKISSGLSRDMEVTAGQDGNNSGTYRVMRNLLYGDGLEIGATPSNLAFLQNGVLDVKTRTLSPHSPEYFTTNILPYSYDPSAKCVLWLATLDQYFLHDPTQIVLLQQWFGAMLTGGRAHQKIMFLLGPTRSGKGTVGRVLEALVGEENLAGALLSSFAKDSFLCSLMTKSVVFVGDAEKNVGRLDRDKVTANLKGISSGDKVYFDRKYKSAMHMVLPCRITIAANHMPLLFDDSGALAKRFMFLRFEESFLGRENDTLSEDLIKEMPGIAVWALDGLRSLEQQGGFIKSASSDEEQRFFIESTNPIAVFVGEVCVLGDPHTVTSANELYDAYLAWATANRETSLVNQRTLTSGVKTIAQGKGCTYGPHRHPLLAKVVKGFKGMAIRADAPSTAQAFTPKIVN